ncbi:MAG: glycosyltransferase [Sphingobacteriales bacterium]|jgi:GT2 family glycosyltransferase|nr:glycosyltransferase [Sphingobacteriales bacterium]
MSEKFSFLIISFNRAEDTIDAVRNVLGLDDVNGWEKEIIVLNNGSTQDYSVFEEYLKQLSPKQRELIKYIYHPKNLGVAGGRNLCIREASGKYLLFMDDDAEIVQQNVIQLVLDKFVRYMDQKLAIIGFLGKIPATGNEEMPLKNPHLIEGKNEIFYNLFFGYGHVFPKSLIEETGYYQEDFFYGMEEYDLSYATVKAGYSILFTKDILVLHKINPNGREPGKTTFLRMFHNKLVVVYKHLPMLYVITHFILWSLFFLVKSKFDFAMYLRTLPGLRHRLKYAPRKIMDAAGMDYLRKVGARLWY